MKYRKLRIAWSVAWGVVAVLLCVLWVRSYWWSDEIYQWRAEGGSKIKTLRGEIEFENNPYLSSEGPVIWKMSTNRVYDESNPYWTTWGFAWENEDELSVVIPFWFLVISAILIGVIAVSPRLRWPKRFSLRTLLIVTTLIAAGMWLFVSLR